MASTSLKFTPSGAGDSNRIFTLSMWFKRSIVSGTEHYLFECNEAADNNDNFRVIIASGENIIIQDTEANVSNLDLRTDMLFRDTTAWYHLVLEVDTTQATAANRAKLYINGEQITDFSTETYPSQNYDTNVSQSGEPFIIGRRESAATPTSYFNGEMAHVHFIDGTAYDADTFGETETSSGIWKPKVSPSVTYGTNGFFLKFQDSSSLGDDSSGNTNDFTMTGTGTQTLDTPSNIFSTLNSVVPTANIAYTNGSTTQTSTTNGWDSVASSFAVSKGKWYAEVKWVSGSYIIAGIENANVSSAGWISNYPGYSSEGFGYGWDGDKRNNAATSSYGATLSTGDIVGIAIDMDNKYLYFSKNGTWQNSGDPESGSTGTGGLDLSNKASDYYFTAAVYNSSHSWNFGNGYFGTTAVASANSDSAGLGQFEYSVPSGYYALCTKNIAEYG